MESNLTSNKSLLAWLDEKVELLKPSNILWIDGSIFLALQLIVSLVAQGVYAKPYAKLMQFVMDNAASFSSFKSLPSSLHLSHLKP